jgi:hypothetical protein
MSPAVIAAVEIAVNVEVSIDVDVTVDVDITVNVCGVDIAVDVSVTSGAAVHILTAANARTRYVAIYGSATAGSSRATTCSRGTATASGPSPTSASALGFGCQNTCNKQKRDNNC